MPGFDSRNGKCPFMGKYKISSIGGRMNNNQFFTKEFKLAEAWTYRYGRNTAIERRDFMDTWAEAAYLTLPLCDSVTIPVYDRNGKEIEQYELAGPTVYSSNPRMYKFSCDAVGSYCELEQDILKNTSSVCNGMFPSHPNWIEQLGEFYSYRILTADDAPDFEQRSENFARGQLYYHLKPGKSRFLGKYTCRIVDGGILEEHDGFSYGRKSAFPMVPGTLWKVIGYKNLKSFHKNQELVVKGIIRLLDDADFDYLMREYDITDSNINVIVPKVTCKFYAQEANCSIDFYTLFRGVDRMKARYSMKMFKTLPLTPYGLDLGYSIFSAGLDEIFTAVSSKDRGSLISLMGKAYREYVESMDEDTDLSVETTEITATMNTLLDLPMGDEEIVGKTLHTLLKGMRKVSADGMTGVACPDHELNWFEVMVPKAFLRKYGKKVGDKVTLYRAPFTGIEAATCVIVGITEEGIGINPSFWASRYSGDFDGDLAGILLEYDLIDEAHIGDAVSSKKKGKKAHTVAAATAKAYLSKLLISRIDMFITACLEKGIDPSPARELMQATIDMVKHEVELPENMEDYIEKYLGEKLSIPAIHTILNLYRSDERLRQSTYNTKVWVMHQELSNIPLLRKLINHFPLVLCKSKYIAANDHGEVDKVHVKYMDICKKVGQADFAVPRSFKDAPTFTKETVSANFRTAMKMVADLKAKPKTVMIADAIHASYKDMVKCFRKGNKDAAYEIMRKLLRKIELSDQYEVGDAIKYMFLSIVHKSAKIGRDYGWYLKVIAYMPRNIGNWSLTRASKFYGGTPDMNISVVYSKKQK